MKVYYSTAKDFNLKQGIFITEDYLSDGGLWNDFGYYLSFKAYLVHDGDKYDLGRIKFLASGYDKTNCYFTERGLEIADGLFDVTNIMNSGEIVSVPNSMDYYHKLGKIYEKKEAKANTFLRMICDLSFFKYRIDTYKRWDGFHALLREGDISDAKIAKGRFLALGKDMPSDEFSLTYKSALESFEPVTFNFNRKRALGSTNINVLIGENGAGKTHVLEGVVRRAVGLETSIEKQPLIHKVIVAALSPFETFYTKGMLEDELNEKFGGKEDSRPFVDDYAYIGFKKNDGDFDVTLPKRNSVSSLLEIIRFDAKNRWWASETKLTTLIKTLKASIKFDQIELPVKKGCKPIYLTELSEVGEDDFNRISQSVDELGEISFYLKQQQVKLSSGQRIFSYLIPAIIAEIENESLLLLDEPECYLHPALEVALLDMLKHLLRDTKSSAIIATHSAIIAREIEKKAVTILRREGNVTQAFKPSFETYGASLELILGKAFGDYQVRKAYEQELDSFFEKKELNRDTLREAQQDIGDDALMYLTSKLPSDFLIKLDGGKK